MAHGVGNPLLPPGGGGEYYDAVEDPTAVRPQAAQLAEGQAPPALPVPQGAGGQVLELGPANPAGAPHVGLQAVPGIPRRNPLQWLQDELYLLHGVDITTEAGLRDAEKRGLKISNNLFDNPGGPELHSHEYSDAIGERYFALKITWTLTIDGQSITMESLFPSLEQIVPKADSAETQKAIHRVWDVAAGFTKYIESHLEMGPPPKDYAAAATRIQEDMYVSRFRIDTSADSAGQIASVSVSPLASRPSSSAPKSGQAADKEEPKTAPFTIHLGEAFDDWKKPIEQRGDLPAQLQTTKKTVSQQIEEITRATYLKDQAKVLQGSYATDRKYLDLLHKPPAAFPQALTDAIKPPVPEDQADYSDISGSDSDTESESDDDAVGVGAPRRAAPPAPPAQPPIDKVKLGKMAVQEIQKHETIFASHQQVFIERDAGPGKALLPSARFVDFAAKVRSDQQERQKLREKITDLEAKMLAMGPNPNQRALKTIQSDLQLARQKEESYRKAIQEEYNIFGTALSHMKEARGHAAQLRDNLAIINTRLATDNPPPAELGQLQATADEITARINHLDAILSKIDDYYKGTGSGTPLQRGVDKIRKYLPFG